MKKEVKYLTATSLFVLLFLMVSGSFDGVLQTITYILAFIVPMILCLYLYFNRKDDRKILSLDCFKIGREEAVISLGLVFPTITAVLSVSVLVTFVMSLFGREQEAITAVSPLAAILYHALIPTVLEEGVFRYLPLRLVGKRSPRAVVFFSAALFSLVHHSFFSIPHAFVAGILFMTADMITDSILPSLVIHFLNNVCALLLMGLLGREADIYLVFIILGILTVLSLAFLMLKKDSFVKRLKFAFSKGEGMDFPIEIFFLALPSVMIAILELWG